MTAASRYLPLSYRQEYRTHGTAAFESRRRSACILRSDHFLGIDNLTVFLASRAYSCSVTVHFIVKVELWQGSRRSRAFRFGDASNRVYWAGTAPENHDDLNANDVIARPTSGTILSMARTRKVNRARCVARSASSFRIRRSGEGLIAWENMGLPITLLGAV